ncbi:MAG: FtsX-like permease family protein [Roseivirga sp.]|nr:FtsX-like permease family protein [Roseivirga sp.]
MLKNHFLVAFRNFKKKKAFTAINVFGLTIGMTVALLILTYARYEMSYDRFHPNADNIYRVSVDIMQDGNFQVADAQCYPGAGLMAKEEFPEIDDYAMAREIGRILFNNGGTAYNEDRVYLTNPGWLTVFDWQLIDGDRETALNEANMVLLSESAAKKYFGEENPMGKMIGMTTGGAEVPMKVNGIFKDVPENTHLGFDILVSWETGVKYMEWKYDEWGGNNEFMYLLSNQAELDEDFEDRFNEGYWTKREAERGNERLRVYPLTDIHLKSNRTFEAEANGSEAMVNILLMVAAFVLAIAWVNYINLSTARAMERGKEVGVRKVLGSSKKSLIIQFFTEAILINLLALILTLTSLQGALPLFNNLTGLSLTFDLFNDPGLLAQLAGMFVLGALASGLYPSLVLSNYKPLTVLTGRLKDSGKGLLLRKGLVIFQFTATMLLLVGTITVYNQVNYMRSKDLGMDLERTIVVKSPLVTDKRDIRIEKRNTFKNELTRMSQVAAVSFSGTLFGQGDGDMNTTTGLQSVTTEIGKGLNFSFFNVDDQFIPAFDIELLAGRNFNRETEVEAVDDPGNYHVMILNESSRKLFGFASNEAAIEEKIWFGNNHYKVVGVINDYNHNSLKSQVSPIIFLFDKLGRHADFMSVKINAGSNADDSYKSVLADLQDVYRDVYPTSDFEYYFLNEQFNEQYKADQQFGLVFSIFSGLSILISILGLFGLGLYEMQQRIKEIGIRKVLGASSSNIIGLLSINFLRLIIISVIISLPIAYLGADAWLDSYAYRIGLSWVLFVIPAVTIVLVAMITIITQTLNVARRNPVDALRYE